jgi:lipoprotein-releasing system permease protein
MIERLIALRYLFSKKGISLVSTLTFISIGGVTIGTALLIVVLSVFNGFHDLIQGLLLSSDPDIRIERTVSSGFPYNVVESDVLQEHDDITYLNPYVKGKAILSTASGDQNVVDVLGIFPDRYFPNFERDDFLLDGFFDVSQRDGISGILLNQPLMTSTDLYIGSRLTLMSAKGIVKGLTQFSGPRTITYNVNGMYRTSHLNSAPQVIMNIRTAERLFYMPGQISGIDLRLTSHEVAENVAADIRAVLGDDFSVQTWYDLQKPLYDVMKLEKWASYVILMIIVLVAVLNIIGSLTMIVIQKNRDIGLLMAIGLTPDRVKKIFQLQGLFIGVIGSGLGGALGLLLSWLQKTFGLVKLSGTGAFIIDAYPVMIMWTDVSIVIGGSLALCLIASRWPSRRATAIDPAAALKYE